MTGAGLACRPQADSPAGSVHPRARKTRARCTRFSQQAHAGSNPSRLATFEADGADANHGRWAPKGPMAGGKDRMRDSSSAKYRLPMAGVGQPQPGRDRGGGSAGRRADEGWIVRPLLEATIRAISAHDLGHVSLLAGPPWLSGLALPATRCTSPCSRLPSLVDISGVAAALVLLAR